jgi:NADPH-dependent glutamate synthase beta subunit-like oxidoreductase/NAD-dependent dihydropyrimidine dehydrogenase PreA subunit
MGAASMGQKKVLVMGGGVAGIRAVLAEADSGSQVYLIEHFPGIGGERIARDKIVTDGDAFDIPDLAAVKSHKNVEVLTGADLEALTSENGRYSVSLRCTTPRVDRDKCNDCGACIKVCPVHMYDDYNEGLVWRTAIDFFNTEFRYYNIFREDMPVCQRTCPINLDIRAYVGQIADGEFSQALATIRRKLPFPLSIGRVCPHPCEDACNRGYKDEPISICFLKRFVADHEFNSGLLPSIQLPEVRYPEKVAIIGGGPSGLTCAYHLAITGYEHVVVFEALPEPGGMFRVGIPEYRLPKEILAKDIGFITQHGVEIRTGIRVGKDILFDDIQKEYDAVLIAIGAHQGMKMGVRNEDAAGVFEGVAFLRNAALGREVPNKGTAVVVGGGNVAMDVARTGIRIGFDEVHLLYRRTRNEMPASPWEVSAAEEEGVNFQFLVAPQEVVLKDGRAVGIKCLRMRLGEPDATGRRKPVAVEGSEFVVVADAIFAAIGQVTDNTLVGERHGFQFGRKLNFEVNPHTFETNVRGVFASGDAATGADIAVRACAGGKKAAESIHRYLRAKN